MLCRLFMLLRHEGGYQNFDRTLGQILSNSVLWNQNFQMAVCHFFGWMICGQGWLAGHFRRFLLLSSQRLLKAKGVWDDQTNSWSREIEDQENLRRILDSRKFCHKKSCRIWKLHSSGCFIMKSFLSCLNLGESVLQLFYINFWSLKVLKKCKTFWSNS